MATQLDAVVSASAPHLVPWLPLIGIVAGVEMPMTQTVADVDAQFRRERLESVTSEALGAVFTDPTLFVFNDVHFMDEASCDLLDHLCADAAERPWLMILTRRNVRPSQPQEAPHTDCIVLEPLDKAAAGQYLAAVTSHAPLPSHKLAQLAERAAGNPLFLQELAAGAELLGDVNQLPDTIEGMVAARIDALPLVQRRLLRSAAVLGMTVDLDLRDRHSPT